MWLLKLDRADSDGISLVLPWVLTGIGVGASVVFAPGWIVWVVAAGTSAAIALSVAYSTGGMTAFTRSVFARALAWHYVIAVIAVIVGINVVRLNMFDDIELGLTDFLAHIILILCAYPLWRHLKSNDRPIPFVPLLTLVYGLYFALPAVLPVENYGVVSRVEEASKIQTLELVLLGLSVLIGTYYAWPSNVWRGVLPEFSSGWSRNRVLPLAVLLAVIATPAKLANVLGLVPVEVGGLTNFVGELLPLSCAMLLVLQLRGQLSFIGKLLLWGVLIPEQALIDLGSGLITPIVRTGILLLMIYMAIRKSLPWRTILVMALLFFALHAVKGTFRTFAWGTENRTGDDLIGNGQVFLNLSAAMWSEADEELVQQGLEQLVRRIDYLSIFSYVVEMTPDHVPFWMGATYTPLLSRPIPRIVYPNKPSEEHGQTFGHRYGILSFNDSATSINFAQLVEMYANFGVIGVIAGMFVLGVLYSGLSYTFNHNRLEDWGLVSGAFILSRLMQIEGNFSGVVGSLLYVIPTIYVLRFFLRPHRFAVGDSSASRFNLM